jgi:hypothetical protein
MIVLEQVLLNMKVVDLPKEMGKTQISFVDLHFKLSSFKSSILNIILKKIFLKRLRKARIIIILYAILKISLNNSWLSLHLITSQYLRLLFRYLTNTRTTQLTFDRLFLSWSRKIENSRILSYQLNDFMFQLPLSNIYKEMFLF